MDKRALALESFKESLEGHRGDQAIDNITAALYDLGSIQSRVSSVVPGCITGGTPTKDQIRTYGLAMMIEMAEFIQTLDWKPWKQKTIDRPVVIDEFADILAFMGIIILYLKELGITPLDLAQGYQKKSVTNINRFLGLQGLEYLQKEQE